jgi:hypothetical protein
MIGSRDLKPGISSKIGTNPQSKWAVVECDRLCNL